MKMCQFKALTSPNVFAVHSDYTDKGLLAVGVLALSDDFNPGIHSLYSLDGKFVCSVDIPVLSSPCYGVALSVVTLSNVKAS